MEECTSLVECCEAIDMCQGASSRKLVPIDWQDDTEFQHSSKVQNWAEDRDAGRTIGTFTLSLEQSISSVRPLCCRLVEKNADGKLQEFAERVAETELRVLLGYAFKLAGYDCSLHQILESREESMTQEL
jgi:hypothetical protein